jgi:uncharacterized membrane protein (DUF485 family)
MATQPTRAGEGERIRREEGAPQAGDVVDAEAFDRLVRARRRFTIVVGGLFLALFLTFLALAGWAHDFMGERIASGLTVGYALAVVCIVAVWLVAWGYGRTATRSFDPLSDEAIDEASRS